MGQSCPGCRMEVTPTPHTLTCLLCGGLVSFKKGDKSRFLSHALNDHDAFLNAELLLAITFLTGAEREHLIAVLRPRFEQTNQESLDVKRSISEYFKAGVERKETEESGSDNKIIYGIPRRNKKLRN